MEIKIDRQNEFRIDRKAFERPLSEIIGEAIKLFRGLLLRRRMDSCGGLLRAGRNVRILKKNASLRLGRKVQLHAGVKLSAWGNECFSEIVIGDNSSIGDRTEIHAGKRVEIGCGCNIAWDVCIMDRDYHKFNSESEIIKPVRIEDNVWIGCNCTILKGVTIGRGAVVAAGSIVTKDVPPDTLVGGNPARVIKEGIYWKP